MENETKADKFRRLAEGRTKQILDGIRKLANLSNDHAYTYTEQEINRIFRTVEENLDLARHRFDAELKFAQSARDSFKL